jgi:hypothetical protein
VSYLSPVGGATRHDLIIDGEATDLGKTGLPGLSGACGIRRSSTMAPWVASAAIDDAVCFAWLPACCATSVSFATASSAFARMPCEAGSAAGDWLARADAGAELVERCLLSIR